MAVFRYRALTPAGAVVDGEVTAISLEAAVDSLQRGGHLLVEADEQSAPARGLRSGVRRAGSRTAPKLVVMMTRELATLLNAKLPLDHALEILIDVTDAKALKRLLARIRDRVREGETLADALGEHPQAFSRLYVSMVRAGEAGASLDVSVNQLAEHLERSQALREKVMSALIYPAILLVVVVLSLILLFSVVLPEFKPLFELAGKELPFATQVVMAVGAAAERLGPFAVVAGLLAAVMLKRQLARPAFRQRWDAMLLSLPVLGHLVAALETARLTRSLAMLMRNGLPVPLALATASETIANSAMSARLVPVIQLLKEGQGLATPLAQAAVMPPLAIHLIEVGEETGQLEQMLTKGAEIYDAAFERSVDRLLAILVPALTLAFGMIVAAIIASVLLAVLSVNELAF
jgi:general secretion pathway protein F